MKKKVKIVIGGTFYGDYFGEVDERKGYYFGKPKGQGTLKTKEGTYVGEVQVGGLPCGKGTFNYLEGSKYTGDFKSGVWSGKGNLTFDEGGYVGEFKKGKPHGFGKDYDANGKVIYEGQYEKGYWHGKGTFLSDGGGKFVGEFLGIEPIYASLIMVVLAMIYTLASGLYGVVWTDVFQGIFIFGVIIYVSFIAMTKVSLPEEFFISVPMADGSFSLVKTFLSDWTRMTPPMEMNMPEGSSYSIYNLFGIAIMFYLFKVTLEGSSGAGGYMLQRYPAHKVPTHSDRTALRTKTCHYSKKNDRL